MNKKAATLEYALQKGEAELAEARQRLEMSRSQANHLREATDMAGQSQAAAEALLAAHRKEAEAMSQRAKDAEAAYKAHVERLESQVTSLRLIHVLWHVPRHDEHLVLWFGRYWNS